MNPPMQPQDALKRIIEHREIFHDEMISLMRQIMSGSVSPVMIAAIITGLRVKKETIGEIAAAAFVAAAAGAKIAKHGGRSVSSQSGSADVLEALGVNINLTPAQTVLCMNQVGFGFMFAPNYHNAMKHAAPVRKELGIRTLFNILGPLTNPAGARQQLMGVFHADLVGIQARVLQRLGSRRVMIVHGEDGMDEITLSGNTLVAELKDGEVHEYTVHPQQFGLNTADLSTISVASVQDSRDMLLGVLNNQPGPARDIVQLNAGAAIYVAGKAPSLAEGIARAGELLASGAAKARLDQLIEISNTFREP